MTLIFDLVLLLITTYSIFTGMFVTFYIIMTIIIISATPLIYSMYGNNTLFTRTYINAIKEVEDISNYKLMQTISILGMWVGMLVYFNMWIMVVLIVWVGFAKIKIYKNIMEIK